MNAFAEIQDSGPVIRWVTSWAGKNSIVTEISGSTSLRCTFRQIVPKTNRLPGGYVTFVEHSLAGGASGPEEGNPA
ncbi:hypothetical protein T265_01734 [Opisthorchis viverrini]|uniref:Uncharacterized protein n=1 Tax=Opisthorchis viverrini TaxID=6198 RepID=A0A075A1J1_OPIVI|nr:hypothetical protein T265_01734 [Opisthorchis viverrini]KER32112.1 hypothetical protein T265_01734 [Opisthorchis viverrini]